MKKNNYVFLTAILLVIFSVGCNKNSSEKKGITENDELIISKKDNDSIVKKKNIIETYSTNIKQLSKLINLKKYRPISVKYHYTFIDNSRGRSPGPSDNFLEAELVFDDKTMEEIFFILKNTEIVTINISRKKFEFSWLDNETKKELAKQQEIGGESDFLFDSNSEIWILKNKILLKEH